MNGTIYGKRFDSESICDVSEEFTLPDYIPEVRRVIGVRASASIDGKYLSGDELEADGGVTYTVLYIGGEGDLCQTSQTSSYTGRLSVRSDEDDRFTAGDLILSGDAENVSCRVTAPRKITLSSRVRLHMLSQKERNVSLKWDGGTERAVGERQIRMKNKRCRTGRMGELRTTGECGGEIREREGMKLLLANGEICFSDVRVNGNRASMKGDAYLTLVLCTPSGEYITSRSRAPIEDEIALPESSKIGGTDCRAVAFGNVVMLELDTSDDGRIEWKMEYDIDCDVIRCDEGEVTEDAYLPWSEEKLTVEEVRSFAPSVAVNGRLTVSTAVKAAPDSSFVCAWGSGSIDKCEISGGRALMNGNVLLKYVTIGNGEAVMEEAAIPLKYECDALPGASDTDDASLSRRTMVRVTDIQARQDGDMLNLTAELAISAAALSSERLECAVAISPEGNADTAAKPTMLRVYVPDRGETPWDVEKRFRIGKEISPTENSVYII